jgi:hypothetical protein
VDGTVLMPIRIPSQALHMLEIGKHFSNFIHSIANLQFIFLASVIGVKIFNILDSLILEKA